MKNEEKAKEIALKYAIKYLVSRNDSHKQNILFKESSISECEKASLQMAKWKDEQLEAEKQALIDKACEWMEYHLSFDVMMFDKGVSVDTIVSDFKQAMKGGEQS